MLNKVTHGDCFDAMQKVPKESVDLVLTDPPYNISSDTKITRNGGKFGEAETIDSDQGEWDHGDVLPRNWVPLAAETLTENGVFVSFYGAERITDLVEACEENGLNVKQVGAWHKTNPPPEARKVKWQSALELFVIATVNQGQGHHYNWEQGQHHNVIETPLCMGNERFDHPTQKPEKLMKPIVNYWSFPGDTVMDPFAGTGTIPAVAKKLGRDFIAVESDEKYVKWAENRLDSVRHGELLKKMEGEATQQTLS